VKTTLLFLLAVRVLELAGRSQVPAAPRSPADSTQARRDAEKKERLLSKWNIYVDVQKPYELDLLRAVVTKAE
jgi:hypothetical protein